MKINYYRYTINPKLATQLSCIAAKTFFIPHYYRTLWESVESDYVPISKRKSVAKEFLRNHYGEVQFSQVENTSKYHNRARFLQDMLANGLVVHPQQKNIKAKREAKV